MGGRQVQRTLSLSIITLSAGVMVSAMSIMQGCETASSDFADLFEPFSMPAPGEAARWMYDRNPDLRRRGVTLIYASPFGSAEPYIRQYEDMVKNDPDPLVRAAAIRALARHGEPRHAIAIAEQLTHESVHVRWEAAKGLQRLHNPEVVGVLRNVLTAPTGDPDVRAAAAHALGQYPEDRAFQALLQGLDRPELSVNLNAREALMTLTGQDFGLNFRAWQQWYERTPSPFAERRVYVYPTFVRDDRLIEHIAFWTKKQWELPGTPVGLEDGTRRTYEEADQSDASGG